MNESVNSVTGETICCRQALDFLLAKGNESIVWGGHQNRSIRFWLNLSREFSVELQRKCLHVAVPNLHQVAAHSRDPDSTFRIGCQSVAGRYLRTEKFFLHPKILNTDKFSRFGGTLRPNVAICVLGDAYDHSEWMMVRLWQAAEMMVFIEK